ncbi:MAG: hypothetical protein POG24_11440, partial [Acidocella sp.]|nr:hypothetical protein [Acidocella sp.]
MHSFRSRMRLVCVTLGLVTGLSASAMAQTPPTVFQSWLTSLSKHGFGVTQGSAVVSSVAYCNSVVVPVFGTCFLQDPNDPYIATLMPSSGEYVDPYFGQMDNQTLPNGGTGGSVFTLGTNEAEVTIINLPPQAAYFSYQGYVFTRPTNFYKRVSQISPDPSRADLFASYSNSINSVDILKQSGLSWGQGTIAIISTANAALANALAKQFNAVGGSNNVIFTDPMGLNVHPGTDQTADDFISLMRYLVPANQTNSDNWLNNIANNMFVYRVDAPSGSASLLYATQTLLTKSYNFNETTYSSDVSELATIMESWLKTQESKPSYQIKQSGETEKVSQSGVILSGDVGFAC